MGWDKSSGLGLEQWVGIRAVGWDKSSGLG